MTIHGMNKKQTVIARLYAQCRARGNLIFTNDEVKREADALSFKNYFDATKIDNSAGLPSVLTADDAFLVHLGNQRPTKHQFVHGIADGYHMFEPIPESRQYNWIYRPSVLNNANTSESNILSVGYNQRIIHDFLYEDITASPKIYGSNRTQISFDYNVDHYTKFDEVATTWIRAQRVQIEIDLTMEYHGNVTIFEAKNGTPKDFNVFQIFNAYRYIRDITHDMPVKSINCCYLLRMRSGSSGTERLRLYLYTFTHPETPGSIKLARNAEYTLVPR